MRLLAAVVATALVGTGCVSNSFRIPTQDLQQLAQKQPETRGEKVRVIQEINATPTNAATPVDSGTVYSPNVNISISTGPRGTTVRGGSGGGLKGLSGGSGGDGKAAAVAIVVVAAVALVAAAAVEGSRFDGYARLHPMHPVHLIGRDGGYTIVPLAWIDPALASWTDTAIVKPTEGPWLQLDRAPLSRQGGYYGMYTGPSTLRSADKSLDLGTTFTIQGGYFPTQQFGIVASILFGWRDNAVLETLFESRYTLELQAFPVAAGPVHLGLYGGAGWAYRAEDGLPGGNASSTALTGGAMLQLDVNTRIALTARLGVAQAHGEYMKEALFGLAVY